MCLGVVRSRHVPHKQGGGGMVRGGGGGGTGRRTRWGEQLSFSFLKMLTVIFRVLFSLFAPRRSEWKRK